MCKSPENQVVTNWLVLQMQLEQALQIQLSTHHSLPSNVFNVLLMSLYCTQSNA